MSETKPVSVTTTPPAGGETAVKPPAAAAPPAAPPAPAAPVKPAPPKPPAKDASRRGFLLGMLGSWITIAWITFTASLASMVLWTVRFLYPNVLSEPPSTFKAGFVDDYEENKVTDKYKEVGSWVVLGRDESNRRIIYALSTTCTHLGCTPNWLEGDKKFKCPCHGSGFKITGVNFEGPAPRPLERYAIRKTDDGQLIVDKGRKFQKELGQWEDPGSYVLV